MKSTGGGDRRRPASQGQDPRIQDRGRTDRPGGLREGSHEAADQRVSRRLSSFEVNSGAHRI